MWPLRPVFLGDSRCRAVIGTCGPWGAAGGCRSRRASTYRRNFEGCRDNAQRNNVRQKSWKNQLPQALKCSATMSSLAPKLPPPRQAPRASSIQTSSSSCTASGISKPTAAETLRKYAVSLLFCVPVHILTPRLQAFDPVPNFRNRMNVFQNAPVFGRWDRASGQPIYVHGPVEGVNLSHLLRSVSSFHISASDIPADGTTLPKSKLMSEGARVIAVYNVGL